MSLRGPPCVHGVAGTPYGEVHDRDYPKLPGDSGEVLISEWSGWQFDPRYEIFSLLNQKELTN